jgi:possible homing endonuclease
MGNSQFVDIAGQTFNSLTALRCIDRKNRIWEFKCSCGKICTGRKNDVVSGKKKSCGHLSNRGGAVINIGDKFGDWEVIEDLHDRKYLCRCSCGLEKPVHGYDLRKGNSKSCGHSSKGTGQNGRKELEGQRVGEWTVGKYLGNSYYECTCSCGTKKILAGTYLRTGQSKSCGCISNKFNDMTGQVYGKWTVLEFVGDYKWRCKCECGNESIVLRSDLIDGSSTCCGKCSFTDIANKKFGMLTAIKHLGDGNWECECECGNRKSVNYSHLVSGSTKSCGCLKDVKELSILDLITEKINEFKDRNESLPFIEDIADYTGLVSATITKYVDKYGLREHFNLRFGSRYERDIYDIVKELLPNEDIILHDRKLLYPREIDIYIPSKELGIEFNGTYWHSTKNGISKDYHREKSINAIKKGIHLIHIFEYEWKNKDTRDKIINLIKHNITDDKKVIYGRKTIIKEISVDESSKFINKYHLQGYTYSKVNIGCYYNDELVSVLTLSKPRFNNNYEWEIVRYCVMDGVVILGGAEKMFEYFKERYKPSSILTYIDLSKFKGGIYSKLGFTPDGADYITNPNYVWVNITTGEVKTRYSTQKSRLIEMGLTDGSETEEEVMDRLGFVQIFNSGNIRMVYKI